jgi:hypothetical protein
MLGGSGRAPEPYFHSGLAGLDVEIACRAEHVAPIASREDQMVERACRLKEGGDRSLILHVHGLTLGSPTELLGRRLDAWGLAGADDHFSAGLQRR